MRHASVGHMTEPRVAVVTGAGRGIGAAVAERLVGDGYLVAVSDADPETCRSMAARLGERAVPVDLDVRDMRSVQQAVTAVERLGQVCVVVNNAGISRTGPTSTLSIEDWTAVIDTNLSGCFRVSQGFAPALFQAGRSTIVNIGSMYSLVSAPGRAAYTAAKHGIVGLTRSLALEWGRLGVRVNVVLPGWLDTDMFQSQVALGNVDLEYLTGRIPLGELGAPHTVGDVVSFLCSDAAQYVTGQAIAVDGGYLANGNPAPFASDSNSALRPM